MASIRKRGNTYQITVSNGRDHNGKKLVETTTFTPDPNKTEKQNQKALEKYAYEFEEMVHSGKYLDGEKITFSQFAETWFKDYAETHLEKDTIYNYRLLYRTHIEPAIGHLKLSRIQPVHLNRLYNTMLKERKDGRPGGYSTNTINRTHAVIRSIMSTAVKWNVLMDNPCERVTTPKQTRDISDVKFFTPEQAITFLDAVDQQLAEGKISLQFKVLFHLALFCGLRRSELIALTWDDIDFKNSTVTVNKATVVCGKDVITKSTKNKSSNRTITVPFSVMDLLRRYRTEQKKLKFSLGTYWKGNNYIFIKNDGSQMYPDTAYDVFKTVIRRYNETADDPLPNIPFHGLRHTSATLLIGNNVDVRTVSGRLGHSQTSTTMNIYAHSLQELDQEASDTLEDVLERKAN